MAKETETISFEGYTKVTLKRTVIVDGHTYRAGSTSPFDRRPQEHVVDAATLAALGDAVATQIPMK